MSANVSPIEWQLETSAHLYISYVSTEVIYNINSMWDKAYLLAFMLVGCNFVAGFLIGILEVIFRTKIGGLALVIQFAVAYTIGQLYVQNRGSLMPQALKLWTSAYYILISVGIMAVVLLVMNLQEALGHFPILGLLGLFSALGFIFTYWGLSSGSKAYMKKTRK